MEKKMFLKASPLIFQNAKQLRNHLTNSEMKLWGYLRTKPFRLKFRRQHPLGIYIADFYCHALKLIIEVDGNIHEIKGVALHDDERQSLLEKEGFLFLRFCNADVQSNFEKVITEINQFIQNKIPPLGG